MVLGGLGDGGERPVAPVVGEAAGEDVALDRARDGMDVVREEAGDFRERFLVSLLCPLPLGFVRQRLLYI